MGSRVARAGPAGEALSGAPLAPGRAYGSKLLGRLNTKCESWPASPTSSQSTSAGVMWETDIKTTEQNHVIEGFSTWHRLEVLRVLVVTITAPLLKYYCLG